MSAVYKSRTFRAMRARPTAWWPFREGTGTTTRDAVSSNNGTISGASWSLGADNQYALDFDGTNDSLACGSGAGLDFGTGDFWVSFWITPDVWTTGTDALEYMTVCGNANYGGHWDGIQIGRTGNFWGTTGGAGADGGIMILTGNGGTENAVGTASALTAGNMYHLVFVRSGGTQYVYLNGALSNSRSITAYNVSVSRTFYWGRNNDATYTRWYDGKLWSPMLCKGRALSASEANYLYRIGRF